MCSRISHFTCTIVRCIGRLPKLDSLDCAQSGIAWQISGQLGACEGESVLSTRVFDEIRPQYFENRASFHGQNVMFLPLEVGTCR